jgi:UDP-N-acetylmuramoylalanine--D-glutamate ligase
MADPRSLFEGKRITVMGLGLLGRGLGDTRFLIRNGAHVTVTDLKTPEQLAPSLAKLDGLPVTYRLGEHRPEDFMNTDMVLRNADVPRSSGFLKIAADHGVPVEMDESLFCKHFEGQVIGITGTRGKTTTTTLIHRILAAHRSGVHLAGNIMGQATLPLLETAGKDDIVVLELSSWQLQGFHDSRISPHAAVFTNVYPDHLNRYAGMQDYIEDKKAIFRYQNESDFCVFNGDQPETAAMAAEAPAGVDFFRLTDVPAHWDVKVPGLHNRRNISAALRLARRLNVPEEVIRSQVENFRGVEHRLQSLGAKNRIAFINDSTSTTPVAGCAALDSVDARRILLIAGGSDKNLDLQPFAEAAALKCHRIALLQGTATDLLQDGIVRAGGGDKIIGAFNNLRDAVRSLYEEAEAEDAILLSPGCASFGMFQNEFHRGETFIRIVEDIFAE